MSDDDETPADPTEPTEGERSEPARPSDEADTVEQEEVGQEAADTVEQEPAGDETAELDPDATMPGAAGSSWAGRAQVPTGGPSPETAELRTAAPTQPWEAPPPRGPGRSWWIPALLALAALVLLGMLVLGIWLIVQALQDDDPRRPPPFTPSPTATESPTPEPTERPQEPPPRTADPPEPTDPPSPTGEPPPTEPPPPPTSEPDPEPPPSPTEPPGT